MSLELTEYYYEFLRYSKMAALQQKESNIGLLPHKIGNVDDDLMRNVTLYDVVERKYAGFTQIILDIWYGHTKAHPYYDKLHEIRLPIAKNFKGWRAKRSLPEMLYLFLIHRLTGSAINYAKQPSGYHNTVLPGFYQAGSIEDMAKIFMEHHKPKYTSVGYQFPAFPKPEKGFARGGDYFIVHFLPRLVRELSEWLEKGGKKDLREVGSWMFNWNKSNGLRAYKFQYAALIADIADFYPKYVNVMSPFYYGTNAIECIKYMAKPTKGLRGEQFLDAVMLQAEKDTGYSAYNIEDQMCDCIRWVENYVQPGHDYNHLDRDKIWSSHKIKDHPFGRQKPMLKLGLVKSFNNLDRHPADDFVLKTAGWSVEKYKTEVNRLNRRAP